MKFRRNADDDLRALERRWRSTRDQDDLGKLNAARIRAALPPIGVPAFQLEWGYQAGIPDAETTAWGCRAILTQNGADIVYQSTHGSEENVQNLRTILNGSGQPGLLASALHEVRRLIRTGKIRGDERKEFILANSDNVLILGNTNASHGYLYMTAFIIPAQGADGRPYEVPGLTCEVCDDIQVDFGDLVCSKCHLRTCPVCLEAQCARCQAQFCKNCAKHMNCEQCDAFLCPSQNCERQYPTYTCIECGKYLCTECSGGRIPRNAQSTRPVCEECENRDDEDEDDEDEDEDEDGEDYDDEENEEDEENNDEF